MQVHVQAHGHIYHWHRCKTKFYRHSDWLATMPQMTIEIVKNDDAKVRFYTGFVNYNVFWMFFSVLMKHGAGKLNYFVY